MDSKLTHWESERLLEGYLKVTDLLVYTYHGADSQMNGQVL